MEMQISSEISLMMETADLVCAYVNQIDPVLLTSEQPYCIPPREIQSIMDDVFSDLDQEDWRVNFYFRGYSMDCLKGSPEAISCVGCMLIYTTISSAGHDLVQTRQAMHDHFAGSGRPYEIVNATHFALGLKSCDAYRPLSDELKALDMPEELRLKLLETLSNYHYHVDQLCDLLEPLAQRLLPLLLPWWEKMRPRLEQWKSALSTEHGRRAFLSDINVDTSDLRHLHVSLHILQPNINRNKYNLIGSILNCAVGLEKQPEEVAHGGLTPLEVMTLRLLSSPDRVKMLRAMSGRVMTPKEITRELDINPGSVFRDLNNMFAAKLIDMVEGGTHRSYTTNMASFEKFLRRLHSYVKNNNGQ